MIGHFSKEDIQITETHKKKVNITHYQQSANKNYKELSPHTSRNGSNKKRKKQVLVRMWGRKEPSCAVGGNANWWSQWKTVWRFSKKIKNKTTPQSSRIVIPLLVIYPKNTKIPIQKDTYTLCLQQHFLQ